MWHLARYIADRRGATMIEYAFIMVFLAIILVAVLPPIADAVQGFLGSVDFGLGPWDAGANEAV